MVQLFQPTNITPDTRGAFGNGIVFRRIGVTSLTVSWQINGNTPMTAYKIDFTDMSGSSLYSTGKITLDTPAYGTNPQGKSILFSCEIESLPSSVTSVSEGLMRITQWWSNGTNDYIIQQSPSHYLVRDTVSARISPTGPSNPLTGRNGTFTGAVYGASEDGIMWMRWTLRTGDTNELVKDTGRLYGCVDPTFTYDAFLPGTYLITLSAETSAGVVGESTAFIYVNYEISGTSLPVTASRDCNGESAVSIKWPRLQNIPLSGRGGSETDNGIAINLPTNRSYLEWNTVNDRPMRLSTPWSVMWSGNVTASSETLFTLKTSTMEYSAEVGVLNGAFGYVGMRLSYGGQTRYFPFAQVEWNEGPFMCIITPTAVYWKCLADAGATLYPLEFLFPRDTLYPGGLSGTKTVILRQDISHLPEQEKITSVKLLGPSSVYYFKIFDYGLSDSEANEYLSHAKRVSYDADTQFYLGVNGDYQDYNAGNYPETLLDGTTIQIYRKTGDSSSLEYVGKANVGVGNEVLDYAARSQQGPYTYYVYVLSSEKYINVPFESNTTNPCFWNWTVLSCTENADGSFAVQASYNFGRNLQSGRVSNNNQPGIFQNFTQYPTVMISPQNYQGGTLQSLIGVTKDGEYSDTIDLRDEIYNLSLTTNALFLKNRKGDLLRIRPSGEISMDTMDNTREQAQTVGLPWVEVGDASGVAIYRTGGAS